ncbi:MAG: type II toxin-antitoxin system RelE/ParE family toxin [Methylococcales bacterium]
MRVEYHPAIEGELREITKYCNECAPGLGNELLGEFERQILKIAAMPYRWMAEENNIRRSLMSRFPYVIYFRVVGADLVRVTVVKHQRRHPMIGLSKT